MPKPANDSRWGDRLLRVADLVEKPSAEKAPSNLAVSGRYVLPAETFEYLLKTKPGAGGEIQLTDAFRQLAHADKMMAYIYEGKTYDAGDKLGFLQANVEFGLKDPKLGKAFREYLRGLKL